MSFTAPVFTNAGRQLQTKGLTGTPIVFTKIGIGDGETGNQSITELEALINTVIEVDISTARRTDYSYTVGGSFTNAAMSSGFYWRELGLYAADPDYPDDRSKDILYCYQNAYTLAEYIASAASSIIEKTVRIAAMVGDAENVSATIDSSTVYVTMKELENVLDGYAAAEHGHAISDINGLQTALDDKAPLSHGTHVTYATAAPKAAGTAAVGTSEKVAREDHVHPAQTTVSGNAGSATILQNTRYIDGVAFNGAASITHYGTCSTAADTAAKVVALTGFALTTGAMVAVKFTVTNTAANPTLNVNSTGAKAIYYRGAAISAGHLAANRTYLFMYNGTQYDLVGDLDTNTTYSNLTLGQGYGTCATAAATTAKAGTLSGYALVVGGIVSIKFTYAVPASATLNINSKGAKAIYHKGAAITAGIIEAGDTATFIYDGTQYHLIALDKGMANSTRGGYMSTGGQTFAGNKTFNGQILPNGATAYGTPQARKLSSGTDAATTTNCPSGAWHGQHS